MPDLVVSVTNPNGCSHRVVTVLSGGVSRSLTLHLGRAADSLTEAEERTFAELCVRKLRLAGVTLDALLGRVTHGEEATNVKQYDLIGAGASVTKTNIGTAYVDILPGLNGCRSLIDFTGCTQARIVLNANLIGTGQFGARVVRDSDNLVLFEQANLGAAGERELDTDWFNLPAGFTTLTLVRVQGKSQTAGDDPVFRRCVVLVK